MVFFQPTFHKYFLEQAQGLNPHLAYSFFRYNWIHLFWFLPPHLPPRGKGNAALLSCGTGAVINVWISLLQALEALGLFFQNSCLHTPQANSSIPFIPPVMLSNQPPPLPCTPQPQKLSYENEQLHQLWRRSSEKYPLRGFWCMKIQRSV